MKNGSGNDPHDTGFTEIDELEHRVEAFESRSLHARARRLLRSRAGPWLAFAAIFLPAAAFAPLVLPHVFVNNTVADADQMNANFNAVVNEIQVNADAQLAHEADPTAHGVDGLAAGIAANDAELASQLSTLQYLAYVVPPLEDRVNDVENDVAGIEPALTTLAVNVFGNTADIAALQTPPPDQLSAALCAAADANGDTFRPYTCDPRCDCLTALPAPAQAGIAACDETSPGEFTIAAGYAGPPILGTCEAPLNLCSFNGTLGFDTCINATTGACVTNADCEPLAFCDGGTNLCVPLACGSDADCTSVTVCTNPEGANPSCSFHSDCQAPYGACSSGCQPGDPPALCVGTCTSSPCFNDLLDCAFPFDVCIEGIGCRPNDCNVDADCDPGFACAASIGGQFGSCVPECVTDADCDAPSPLILANVTLSGVSTPNSPTAVQCTSTDDGSTVFSAAINSNDALDCIADAEAVLGQSCTPAP